MAASKDDYLEDDISRKGMIIDEFISYLRQ